MTIGYEDVVDMVERVLGVWFPKSSGFSGCPVPLSLSLSSPLIWHNMTSRMNQSSSIGDLLPHVHRALHLAWSKNFETRQINARPSCIMYGILRFRPLAQFEGTSTVRQLGNTSLVFPLLASLSLFLFAKSINKRNKEEIV